MGAITICGKGSRNRVRNREQYRANFDGINWKSKQRFAVTSIEDMRKAGEEAGKALANLDKK